MNSSDFLSYFTGLSEATHKETLVKNANNIISKIDWTQDTPIKSDKYTDYLKICKNPSEELLYTLRRLLGGLGSTGLEYRKGFSLTLSLLIAKFGKDINMTELFNCAQKETFINKTEKNHLKVCAYSGRIMIYKCILTEKSLSADIILQIAKQIILISKSKSLEESALMLMKDLFEKVFGSYYNAAMKKETKLYPALFKLIEAQCEHKNSLEKTTTNFEFGMYFSWIPYIDTVKGWLPNNIIKELFDNGSEESKTPLKKYIEILLNQPIKDGCEFNVTFVLLRDLLKCLKNDKYAYKLWNVLIDPICIEDFKKVSPKNFELLFYTYSKFILDTFFNLAYATQIFDSSFFISLINFTTNKKFKYVLTLSDIITEMLVKDKSKDSDKIIAAYCENLLTIFGNGKQQKYSPNAWRNFFIFCYSKLSTERQNEYISNLTSNADDSIDSVIYHISALKILLLNNWYLSEENQSKIIKYFLIKFFESNPVDDLQYAELIEERTILIILSLIKPSVVNGEWIQMKSTKAIKVLCDLHKQIHSWIKVKAISIECETYMKYFKKLTKTESADIKGKLVTKLGLVLLVLYMKNEGEYRQEMDDLLKIREFGEGWMSVLTDLVIGIIHKSNSTFGEFAMGIYKKLSKHIGKEGFDVILDFLKDTKIQKPKKELMVSDDEEEGHEMKVDEDSS